MAEPVRVRRQSDQEGQQLRIARRGTGSAIRLRRAMVVLASAGGNTVPVIAGLVQADEDSVRQVIHRFNKMGMACLALLRLETVGARVSACCRSSDGGSGFVGEIEALVRTS